MTVIEFFSDDPIENAASILTLQPRLVKMFGDDRKMKAAEPSLRRFLQTLENPPQISFCPWDTTDVEGMCDTLKALLLSEDAVRVDLTGGNEAAIFAMGRVAEQLASVKTVAMHRFDVLSGAARCVPSGERLPLVKPLALTAEQLVRLHGGETAGSSNGGELRHWTLTPSLTAAVKAVWNAYVEQPGEWNRPLKDLLEFVKYRRRGKETLEVVFDVQAQRRAVKHYEEKAVRVQQFLRRLEKHGAVTRLGNDRFCYASSEVKHCLAKEGNVLEMMTLVAAMAAVDADGKAVFCDAECGVYMDWSGRFGEPDNTHNEVDVVLMHGACPVFISCKNGEVDAEEPFKLRAVADRFGGKRAVAVLIANDVLPEALGVRVEQMGITLLRNTYRLSFAQYSEQLAALVNKG